MNKQFEDFIRKEMTVEEMPSVDMQFIAERCGVDVAVTIMKQLAGTRFFVPVVWQKVIAERFISIHAGDMDVRELSLATGMSDGKIYKTLNKKASDIYDKKARETQTTVLDMCGG